MCVEHTFISYCWNVKTDFYFVSDEFVAMICFLFFFQLQEQIFLSQNDN